MIKLFSSILITFLAVLTPLLAIAQTPDSVYASVEQMPEFPGGMAALMQYVGQHIQLIGDFKPGKVVAQFVVAPDGTVTQPRIVRSHMGAEIDAQVLSAIGTLPKFTPGYQEGKAVSVLFTLPLSLRPQSDVATDTVYWPNYTESDPEETRPQYPGGDIALLKEISSSVRYPQPMAEQDICGITMVQFVVNPDGKVGDITVLTSQSPMFDNEAKRVVRGLKDFIPATRNGKPVECTYTLPITFALGGTSWQDYRQRHRSDMPPEMPKGPMADSSPRFPGGTEACDSFLQQNLTYANRDTVFGVKRYITFRLIVNKDGTIKVDGIEQNDIRPLTAEALRVLQLYPRMIPATKNGKPVSCYRFERFTFQVAADSLCTEYQYNRNNVFTVPHYPGGIKKLRDFISKNLRYPDAARTKGIKGTVLLDLEIDPQGLVQQIEAKHSLSPECCDEAMRLVRTMPGFDPAERSGTPVWGHYLLPIRFQP